MKAMIAILCCRTRQAYADEQRKTWLQALPKGLDCKFFFGEGMARQPQGDEVFLSCPDDYKNLPTKVWMIARWASAHGYTHIFKTDDDVYLRPERLMQAGYEGLEYVGRMYTSYACGLGYWLGPKALAAVANARQPEPGCEDMWVGRVLHNAGISCVHEERFSFVLRSGSPMAGKAPRSENEVILAGEFPGPRMKEQQVAWEASVREYGAVLESVLIE